MSKLTIRRGIAKQIKQIVDEFTPNLPTDVDPAEVVSQVRHVKDPLLEKLATSVGPEA